METILIATDFSDAAYNAAKYGVHLAKFLGARVVLLHVHTPVVFISEPALMVPEKELRQEVEERLKEEAERLKTDTGSTIEWLVEEGLVAHAIMRIAELQQANWMVAGMKGYGKTISRLFGSTILSLRKHLTIPLIVVPEQAVFAVPQSIALASGIDYETDVNVLTPLEKFGNKCKATMHVVRVIKKDMDEVVERLLRPTRIQWHFTTLHPTFDFVNDNDVSHAVNNFVEERQVDVIAIIAKEHSLFDRLFTKSNIRKMVFSAKVPVIILPGHLTEVHQVT